MKVKINDVVTIKLITGEEIIGKLTDMKDNSITLSKPVQLAITQKGMGFAPVCIGIDDASEFTFKNEHILFGAETRPELLDNYIRATTGIQLASSLS